MSKHVYIILYYDNYIIYEYIKWCLFSLPLHSSSPCTGLLGPLSLTGLQKRKQSWRTRVPEVVKLLLGGRNSGLDEIHTEFLYVFGLSCVEWRTEVESLYWQIVVTNTIFKKYPLSRIFNVRQYFFLTILQMFCTFGESI